MAIWRVKVACSRPRSTQRPTCSAVTPKPANETPKRRLHAEKTETETERQRLENEVAAQEREQQIARDRREAEESAALSAEQRA